MGNIDLHQVLRLLYLYMGKVDIMEMLGLKERVVKVAKVNGVRTYGHVLMRDDRHVLRKVLEIEVKGKRNRSEDDQRRCGRCKWRRGASWFGEGVCN